MDIYETHYRIVETVIRYLEHEFDTQPNTKEIARAIGISTSHLSRIFKEWVGTTPKQFVQILTLEHAKNLLASSASVLDASYESGLSGPGRLHDLFVTFDAITPGEFREKAENITIEYGVHSSPFGPCCLAKTVRGICHLSFLGSSENYPEKNAKTGPVQGPLKRTVPAEKAALEREARLILEEEWPKANFLKNSGTTGPIASAIFNPYYPQKRKREGEIEARPFHLHVKGTNFQIQVWRALLSIPEGQLVSYQDIASLIGKPKAYRAAANAIAVNPVALLIPCHRVIRKSGKIYLYRWGSSRKKAIIVKEIVRGRGKKG